MSRGDQPRLHILKNASKSITMRIKKILMLSFALSFMSAIASEPGVTFLFNDGKTASFLFSTHPKVTVGSEELTVSSTDVSSVKYTISNVQRFYFDENIETGIHDVSASSAAGPGFSYNNGVITVSGLKAKESVSVYSIGGSKVGESQAGSDGCASVDISSSVGGVYVISTGGGISFKLLKK